MQGARTGNSYAMNGCAFGAPLAGMARGKTLADFEEVSKWMLLSEEGTIDGSTDDGYQQLSGNNFSDRHIEGSNIGFLDGHVKWYRASRIPTEAYATGGVFSATCP